MQIVNQSGKVGASQ